MIKESRKYKLNVIWFTTLIGKKVNFDKIKRILSDEDNLDVKSIKTTTFYQGKLSRWGLAWTYFTQDEIEKFKNTHKKYNKIKSYNLSGTNIQSSIPVIRLCHKRKNIKTSFKSSKNDYSIIKEI